MNFTEIGETATIILHMDDLEAMARICKAAVDCGEQGLVAEMALAAFTMAAMIARTHADMPKNLTEHMERTRTLITTD